MQLSLLTTIAAFAGLAACQCPSSIPQCAQSCLTIGASSVGCGETDYTCQCTDQHQTDITSNATTCVLAACGEQTALNEVLPAAQAFCSAINAGESCSSASAGSTGTSSTAASSGSSSASGSTPSTSGSQTSTGTGSTATTEGSSSATRTATTTESSGTGTATGASASASSTAGAATMGSVGSLGIAVLGALVML
ncbi:hypothetical protein INS49_015186 [Diaporthe citri]|uniref:uncharacterized protein n=1 Tax=Diaporthe citri TaxID=83186 RepID=UPI001C811A7F|nr:uncharacterized protein INS49_015186 [Diaporthe citri]KAG6357308.1 hypothetical protein INS49_015186 [Diaporthe citri]